MDNFELPKIWYITITTDNYDILKEWWKHKQITPLYQHGICGPYRNSTGKIVIGQTKGKTKAGYFDFDNEITFKQFQEHVLGMKKEKIIINEDNSFIVKLLNKLNIK